MKGVRPTSDASHTDKSADRPPGPVSRARSAAVRHPWPPKGREEPPPRLVRTVPPHPGTLPGADKPLVVDFCWDVALLVNNHANAWASHNDEPCAMHGY